MPKPKNDPIGECPCPLAGCELVTKVYKFRARENEKQRRLAGKMYLRCPAHGQLGADGAQAIQEFIVEYADIWGHRKPNPAGDAPASTPAAAPATSSSENPTPARVPTPSPAPTPAPTSSREVWNL